MLRKRYSINSRHRKNYSPAPLTVTVRPRGLERPRRRRRSEPFSTPKRHFLTEIGRPARPLEDLSCTQRQACMQGRATRMGSASRYVQHGAGSAPALETPAKGHFGISRLSSAPAKPRKQSSECTRNQPCTRSARAILCIGRKPAHSGVDGVVCVRCQQRGCSTEISSSLGEMACPSTQCQPSAIGLHPGPRTWMHDSSRAPCATAR